MEEIFHNAVHECETSETYTKCEFAAEALHLYGQAKFIECNFPNLRYVLFDIHSRTVYKPFEKCDFPNALNLEFDQDLECVLEGDQWQSVITNENQVKINEETFEKFTVKEENFTKEIRYGDEAEKEILEYFRELFFDDDVMFVGDPERTEDGYTRQIRTGDTVLGTVHFKIVDYPFNKAIFEADSTELSFDGEIPENWWTDVHPTIIQKFNLIRILRVKRIAPIALVGLTVELHELVVTEKIGEKAFMNCLGYINSVQAGQIEKDAFGSQLRLDEVTVDQLSKEAGLHAKKISVSSSRDIDGIFGVMTLVIRDEVLSTIKTMATKVDLSTVQNQGPFTIITPDFTVVAPGPQVCYSVWKGIVKVPVGKGPEQVIFEELRKYYLDLHNLDWKNKLICSKIDSQKFRVTLNGVTLAEVNVEYEKTNNVEPWATLALLILVGSIFLYWGL